LEIYRVPRGPCALNALRPRLGQTEFSHDNRCLSRYGAAIARREARRRTDR
jgi:hypothetical protein